MAASIPEVSRLNQQGWNLVFNSDTCIMDKHYDRDRIFKEERRSDFLWCLHCERTYNRGQYRKVDGLQVCAYPDCDGDTVIDAWDWEDVRDEHPEYPIIPKDGLVYPLYAR